jgi:hypothetical protein
MDVNMFNVYLHDWLNGIFFPLFRHVPPEAGMILCDASFSYTAPLQASLLPAKADSKAAGQG